MTAPLSVTGLRLSDARRQEYASVYKDIKPDLDRVEAQLEAWSRAANPLTAEVSRYVLRKKGKRLRPALVLLTARLFRAADEETVFLASLVELVHTASLIHDDIVDKADLRRGTESVHAKWGANVTVLLGDYLYIKSIGLSLESRHDRIVRILADVSARMIQGELDEYARGGDLALSEKDYLGIIENKTAILFAACSRIGAVIGQASSRREREAAEFGLNLGLCFQIVDDLLDFTGDERALGKPVLSDLAEGRITLPLIHALRSDGRPYRDRIAGLLGRRDVTPGERDGLLGVLAAAGSLEYTTAKASGYAGKALEALGRFPDSPPRRALAELVRFVLERRT
ncbi:MAG TPA: polyprenyl synthetase family protein [Burkholderiales bacterium]|nr:polyprenyl synthetase family protein [Burkholderiales bacterium]